MLYITSKSSHCVFLLFVTAILLSGCGATAGRYYHIAETQTHLTCNNFKMVETGVVGSASCIYLFHIIPLGYGDLHARAMNDLRSKIKSTRRSIAFINVTKDTSIFSILLLAKVELTITSDIIEFYK